MSGNMTCKRSFCGSLHAMSLDLKRLLCALEFDLCDQLWWRSNTNGNLLMFIAANDFFYWATSDVEPVETDADIEMLEQAIADCREAMGDAYPTEGPLLYCARHRGLRPQQPYYKYLDERTRPLFDAAGPVRDRASEG
jgi:hypothetical protein